MLYLLAFSRTERVRKLIHIPSLCPKIHSRIPAHEQSVRGNPPVWTCTQTALTHRCNLRPGWSARSWSEWIFAARQRRKRLNLSEESELWEISTNKQVPRGATGHDAQVWCPSACRRIRRSWWTWKQSGSSSWSPGSPPEAWASPWWSTICSSCPSCERNGSVRRRSQPTP